MCSIRKTMLCLTLLALGGCTTQSRSTPGPVNTEPLPPDAAMTYRNWNQSTAYYASGAVVAGSTRFWLEPSPDVPPRVQEVAEVPLFVANTFFVPVTYFIVPPFEPVVYRGVAVPPSYNANPPLPEVAAQQ